MSERAFKIAQISFAAYLLMVIICFGPATVQSERAQQEFMAQCRNGGATNEAKRPQCSAFGPSIADGLPKAVFWPFWLSYMAASR